MNSLPAPEPLRVVIADDHPFYRQGLARSLRASGIDVVAEAANGEAAIRAVDETAPDVVVMDLRMPRMSGTEATRRLSVQAPATRVLVLSVSAEEQDVTDAILAGAGGYVLKERPVQEVIAGVRAIASGELHISPELAMPLLRSVLEGLPEPAGMQLSPEERELLDLLVAGAREHEIADTLAVSPGALRTRASGILRKLPREGRLYAPPRKRG